MSYYLVTFDITSVFLSSGDYFVTAFLMLITVSSDLITFLSVVVVVLTPVT